MLKLKYSLNYSCLSDLIRIFGALKIRRHQSQMENIKKIKKQ